jgi:hypothetical protein
MRGEVRKARPFHPFESMGFQSGALEFGLTPAVDSVELGADYEIASPARNVVVSVGCFCGR